MKKYDIVTFFNELDLLEIRLNILYEYVDYFIIVECAETFSGLPKPLYFQENQQRFLKFAPKIKHYVVQNIPANMEELQLRLQNPILSPLDRDIITQTLKTDNIIPGVTHWLKEFYQKELIRKALVDLEDNDICFISDVDEIWNPNVIIDFTKNDIYKLRQHVYAYYLNNRSNEAWAGTLVTQYKNIANSCLNHLRTASKTHYTYIDNGGWHFTNQGGSAKVIAKLEAQYSEDDFNTPQVKSHVVERLQKNQDYIGRKFKFWIDESELPAYILNHKLDYQHLFKPTVEPIIIKLQGGLGNQLFQYALGRNLSVTKQVVVQYDVSWFTNQTKRQYALGHFNVVTNLATDAAVKKMKTYRTIEGYRGFIHNIFFANQAIYVEEKKFNFDPTILNTKGPAYLDGYWQSPRYFSTIQPQLHSELTLKEPLSQPSMAILRQIKAAAAISVHVRRGDYVLDPVTNQYHGTCGLDYYRAATAYLASKVPNPTFFIFSDDIAWVQANLPLGSSRVYYVSQQPLPDYEELMLMSQCQHHIIANSSFSWWGAWLNPSLEKLVIAPKQWFNTATINSTDLLPKDWIKL